MMDYPFKVCRQQKKRAAHASPPYGIVPRKIECVQIFSILSTKLRERRHFGIILIKFRDDAVMKKSPSDISSKKKHLVKAKVKKSSSMQKVQAVEVLESVETELFKTVRAILSKARTVVYATANEEMVKAYWNVGRKRTNRIHRSSVDN